MGRVKGIARVAIDEGICKSFYPAPHSQVEPKLYHRATKGLGYFFIKLEKSRNVYINGFEEELSLQNKEALFLFPLYFTFPEVG